VLIGLALVLAAVAVLLAVLWLLVGGESGSGGA
jgi:hypothetical protein